MKGSPKSLYFILGSERASAKGKLSLWLGKGWRWRNSPYVSLDHSGIPPSGMLDATQQRSRLFRSDLPVAGQPGIFWLRNAGDGQMRSHHQDSRSRTRRRASGPTRIEQLSTFGGFRSTDIKVRPRHEPLSKPKLSLFLFRITLTLLLGVHLGTLVPLCRFLMFRADVCFCKD